MDNFEKNMLRNRCIFQHSRETSPRDVCHQNNNNIKMYIKITRINIMYANVQYVSASPLHLFVGIGYLSMDREVKFHIEMAYYEWKQFSFYFTHGWQNVLKLMTPKLLSQRKREGRRGEENQLPRVLISAELK